MRVVRAMMLTAQFKGLDPVRLLQEIRLAQQTLSDLAAHGVHNEAAPGGASDVAVFLASLSSAWKDGEARPTRRQQPKVKHWWRNRPDPFADAWPVIEGWLIAEPSVSACALMDRLAAMVPDAYASKAQLRTLQRRVKAWRSQRVKEMVLGSLRKSAAMPAEVCSRSRKLRSRRGPGASCAWQAMDMWTMRLLRTGCERGQRAAARLRCPPPQPSTTCPQPSTIEEVKNKPKRQQADG
jgi:hypothetical protein